jgi:hypothetical protein
VGVAKHRAKVEKRQLQEAIDTGMVKAKGLGKKMRKEKLKGLRRGACCLSRLVPLLTGGLTCCQETAQQL